MKFNPSTLLYAVAGAILLTGFSSFYIVDETNQAVVTQFGDPVGDPVAEPGLHFKVPFIQTVNYFDKRLLNWDGDPNQIPTRDKRYIRIDTTARWRIVDALNFMESMGNEASAQARLDDIIDAATRDAIANLRLVETVRNTNRLVQKYHDDDEIDKELDFVGSVPEKVEVGREELTRAIVTESRRIIESYGIELVDVRIKRIDYLEEVRQKVYERMISERKRVAEMVRSEGFGKRAEIEGQMTKELDGIRSEAYKTAQEIRGKGEAEATQIYGEAYNRDPDFYAFTKTLDAYKKSVNSSTSFLLTTDSEFFRYLESAQ